MITGNLNFETAFQYNLQSYIRIQTEKRDQTSGYKDATAPSALGNNTCLQEI